MEKTGVGGRGKRQETGWRLDAGISMYSYVSLAGSGQYLNASIIHEVVLRYANMNYLTSQADLLLQLTGSPLSSISLYIFSFSPPLTPLYSYTFFFFFFISQNLESLLRAASFSWNCLCWIISGSAGFWDSPLSLSLLVECFCPLFFLFLL